MKKRRKKRNSWIRALVLLICVPLFCVSAYKVSSQLYVDYMQNKRFNSLTEMVNQARANPELQAQANGAQAAQAQGDPAMQPDADSATQPEGGLAAQLEGNSPARAEGQPQGTVADVPNLATQPPMLYYYVPLYEQNPDFFGWVRIDDTVVDYPVMHTPEDPEFYLHRAFDGSQAYSGVPFLDADCFLDCGNYIVYGHNMKNGTQFATIPNYKDRDYWESHPTVYFDTLYEAGTYDVIAAFYSQAYPVNAVGVFRYYQYTDLRDEETFTEYIEQVKAAALYETGVEVEYGDQLLTLSTCEYHRTDGRFVVVAKKR